MSMSISTDTLKVILKLSRLCDTLKYSLVIVDPNWLVVLDENNNTVLSGKASVMLEALKKGL